MSQIRKSTDRDLRLIHAWLADQDAKNIPGTFFCNWEIIKKCHKEKRLTVYLHGPKEEPVAYRAGGLLGAGILEVRHDWRRKGIGRKLINYLIDLERKKDECVLMIQCKPSSSIPFWKRMGFKLFQYGDRKNHAYQILKKKRQLPQNGKPIEITIRFFPEDKKWGKNLSALKVASPKAVKMPNGFIELSERVIFFPAIYGEIRDAVIEIKIAGKILFCDKAKNPAARNLGVQWCTNGFYVDRIISK